MDKYSTEAHERWGETLVCRKNERKIKNYTKEKWAEANDGLMAIFAGLAACKQSDANATSNEAQTLVSNLQTHITANSCTCTDEILVGLDKMYMADERFRKNIDNYGEGTSRFASKAVAVFYQEK